MALPIKTRNTALFLLQVGARGENHESICQISDKREKGKKTKKSCYSFLSIIFLKVVSIQYFRTDKKQFLKLGGVVAPSSGAPV